NPFQLNNGAYYATIRIRGRGARLVGINQDEIQSSNTLNVNQAPSSRLDFLDTGIFRMLRDVLYKQPVEDVLLRCKDYCLERRNTGVVQRTIICPQQHAVEVPEQHSDGCCSLDRRKDLLSSLDDRSLFSQQFPEQGQNYFGIDLILTPV